MLAIHQRELVPHSFNSFQTTLHEYISYLSIKWCGVALHTQAGDEKSIDTYRYFPLSISIAILFSGIDIYIDTNNCIFSPQFLTSFSKNWRKNSTKFPSKCLKICTKVLRICPQISLKFQRNVFKISYNIGKINNI